MILLIVAIAIFVVFFFLFPRPALVALAIIIATVACIGAYLYYQQSGRNTSASLVTATSTGTQGCADPAKPVFVEITNGSDRQVDAVRFRLIAKRPGYSVEAYADYLTSYKIIEPKAVYGTCFALNHYRGLDTLNLSPADLDWSVEISSVDFAGDNR